MDNFFNPSFNNNRGYHDNLRSKNESKSDLVDNGNLSQTQNLSQIHWQTYSSVDGFNCTSGYGKLANGDANLAANMASNMAGYDTSGESSWSESSDADGGAMRGSITLSSTYSSFSSEAFDEVRK